MLAVILTVAAGVVWAWDNMVDPDWASYKAPLLLTDPRRYEPSPIPLAYLDPTLLVSPSPRCLTVIAVDDQLIETWARRDGISEFDERVKVWPNFEFEWHQSCEPEGETA